MELTGAEIVVQFLVDEQVEFVFGYPGGSVLHIYDALHGREDIKHILVRHEQGGTHAADGYARATGKPGVVLVTSGPGATNAVTGIATAFMDSIPMVVLTGQVATHLIGNDAFQEVDSVGITRPCVKHNFLVKDAKDLTITLKKAFYLATTGRPGPVVVDIPKDVTAQKAEYRFPKSVSIRSYQPKLEPHPGQIRKATKLLMNAKRPMIYTGGGVIWSNASEDLRKLVKTLGYPITQTLMGLGAFPASDQQFVGMLGMHGTLEANMAMYECDVLLAIGARFDDRVTGETDKFCPNARIIHVDIDPASISKTIQVEIPIVGEAHVAIQGMLEAIKETTEEIDKEALAAWWERINGWRSHDCLAYDRESQKIKPQAVVEALHKVTGGEAYITTDVGQHQMFAAQFYPFEEPFRWITSGGLGTMGFGLPAAMGVQLAHMDKTVACITGDASIQMCLQELSTCLQYMLPLKIINLNNRYMGMVRQWQEFSYESRYSHSYMDALPDFVKLAEAYGHVGMVIETAADIEPAMREAFAMKDRLVFMDFVTDETENVFPMIEAGKGHHEMRYSPKMRELS